MHRLKASSVILAYGYNKVGQRVVQTVSDDRFLYRPTGTETVDYSANNLNQYDLVSLSGSAPVSPSYDANGNLTSDGTWTFGYDAENRLTSASRTSPTVVNATYAYDVLGRRAAKTVDSVTTQYLSDGNQEIAEYDGGSGTLLRRFVYGVGIDEPLVQITRSGLKFYYRADALGSIVAGEEHSSGFVQRYGYGPFGEATSATGHPYRYAGRRLDDETGLYYYRARMYSVNLGRFLQTDPIGYDGGMNLYAYVGNDPLGFVDPNGSISQPASSSRSGFSLCLICSANAQTIPMNPGAAAPGVGLPPTPDQRIREQSLAMAFEAIGNAAGNALRYAGDAINNVAFDLKDTVLRDSYRARGLRAAGINPASAAAKNYEVHHVVARYAITAQPARTNLAAVGMTVNNVENLVVLQKTTHQGVHTTAYYEAVNLTTDLALPLGRPGMTTALGVVKAKLLATGHYP